MKTRILAGVCAGVTLAIAALLVTRHAHRASAARLEALRSTRDAATEEVRELERRLAVTTAKAESGRSVMATSSGAISDSKPDPRESRAAVARELAAAKKQLRRAEDLRVDLARTYGPFYRMKKLSPETIRRLEDILLDDWHSSNDILAVRIATKLPPNDPNIVALGEQRRAEKKAALIELLGEEDYRDMGRFDVPRGWVLGVNRELRFTSAPLRREQTEQLTAVLMKHKFDSRQNDQKKWVAIVADAAPVLSPAQLAELQRVRDAENLEWEIYHYAQVVVKKHKNALRLDGQTPNG